MNIRDLLPPAPWELFKFRGEEYTEPPLKLRLDAGRGVLYVDDLMEDKTLLRICRIPEEVTRKIPHYYAVLDLRTAVPYISRGSNAKPWEKLVFLNVSVDSFSIETESGEVVLEVLGVPKRMIHTLEGQEFTDITTGYTGHIQSQRLASTPAEDVASRLSVPLGCGWKGCSVIFGVQPFPSGAAMQKWEALLAAHDKAAGHRYRKLREV